jgi:hypothetical protein
MNSQPSFTEKSGFPTWVFWSVISIPTIIFIYHYVQQTHEEYDWIGLLIVVLVALLLHTIKLTVNIHSEGLSFKFPPLIIKPKLFKWDDIESMELMKINPLKEFGGWGLRYGRLGTAYTTRGKHILHVKLKNSKSVNFTIANPERFSTIAKEQNWKINLIENV